MTSNKQLTITYDPVELLGRYDPQNKLERYYELLLQENEKINLVSRETAGSSSCRAEALVLLPDAGPVGRTTPGSALRLLAAQSLLPLVKIDLGEIDNYLDIGSGGGFPAIPILLTRKVKRASLVERTGKKAAALRRILLALDIKATIIDRSFEEVSLERAFDLITLRLVKLRSQLFNRIFFLLRPGGYFVYYAAPNFDLTGKGADSATFYHSTSSGKATGCFTIFHKRV
ncbi:MAG: class I SAM-dependent methyltransferase [Chloroflexi bacterium]|nr:class I SAM-dependent methyltransferase [Chloroflexota bacterium]